MLISAVMTRPCSDCWSERLRVQIDIFWSTNAAFSRFGLQFHLLIQRFLIDSWQIIANWISSRLLPPYAFHPLGSLVRFPGSFSEFRYFQFRLSKLKYLEHLNIFWFFASTSIRNQMPNVIVHHWPASNQKVVIIFRLQLLPKIRQFFSGASLLKNIVIPRWFLLWFLPIASVIANTRFYFGSSAFLDAWCSRFLISFCRIAQ